MKKRSNRTNSHIIHKSTLHICIYIYIFWADLSLSLCAVNCGGTCILVTFLIHGSLRQDTYFSTKPPFFQWPRYSLLDPCGSLTFYKKNLLDLQTTLHKNKTLQLNASHNIYIYIYIYIYISIQIGLCILSVSLTRISSNHYRVCALINIRLKQTNFKQRRI